MTPLTQTATGISNTMSGSEVSVVQKMGAETWRGSLRAWISTPRIPTLSIQLSQKGGEEPGADEREREVEPIEDDEYGTLLHCGSYGGGESNEDLTERGQSAAWPPHELVLWGAEDENR